MMLQSLLCLAMLYLEDYLEMIEHLPIELRDRYKWCMLCS